MSEVRHAQQARFIRCVGFGFNIDNVAIAKKQHLEVPSDVQVILYIPFNHNIKEAVPKLVDRLRTAGFVLRPEAIARWSS